MSHHTMTLLLFNWFSAAVHKKLLLHPDLNQASSEGQEGGDARARIILSYLWPTGARICYRAIIIYISQHLLHFTSFN